MKKIEIDKKDHVAMIQIMAGDVASRFKAKGDDKAVDYWTEVRSNAENLEFPNETQKVIDQLRQIEL